MSALLKQVSFCLCILVVACFFKCFHAVMILGDKQEIVTFPLFSSSRKALDQLKANLTLMGIPWITFPCKTCSMLQLSFVIAVSRVHSCCFRLILLIPAGIGDEDSTSCLLHETGSLDFHLASSSCCEKLFLLSQFEVKKTAPDD